MASDNKSDESLTVKQRKSIGKAQEEKEVEENLVDKDEEKAKQRKAPYVPK